MRLLPLLALLFTSSAFAQAVVAIVDAQQVTDAAPKRTQRAAENVLRQLTSLSVGDGPGFRKGAPKRCSDDCAQQLVKNLQPVVLLLDLKGLDAKTEKTAIDASLWVDGAKTGTKHVEATPDQLETALKPAIAALLPAWSRKGYGSVVLPEGSAVVKVDGRVLTGESGAVVAIPAGTHAVDVVAADGSAVLRRVEIVEGSKTPIDVTPIAPMTRVPGAKPFSALRGVSFGVFMTGALALAAGFIAGALARSSVADLLPCSAGATGCATLDEATARATAANSITTTGNIFLGVGAALAAIGAGLFVIDAVTE